MMKNRNTNQYILKKDYAILKLSLRKKGVFEVFIDKEDIERCKNYTWGLIKSNNGYRVTNYIIGNLNRFLIGLKKEDTKKCVIHINKNLLDCRKENLKIYTVKEIQKINIDKYIKRNEYILKKDVAIIKINSKKYGYFESIIDIEDYEKVKNYTWGISKHHEFNIYYVKSSKIVNGKHKQYHLQRIIMDCPKGLVVDHIDHNPLNNRKSNLRICTIAENGMNRKPNYNNISGYVGVGFDKRRNKWTAYLTIKKQGIKLHQYCDTKEQAIVQRREWEKMYWTEQNFLISEENRKRVGD